MSLSLDNLTINTENSCFTPDMTAIDKSMGPDPLFAALEEAKIQEDYQAYLALEKRFGKKTLPKLPIKGLSRNDNTGKTGHIYGQTNIYGSNFFSGVTGYQGVTGYYGVTGYQGVTGCVGSWGIIGSTGVVGDDGATGYCDDGYNNAHMSKEEEEFYYPKIKKTKDYIEKETYSEGFTVRTRVGKPRASYGSIGE